MAQLPLSQVELQCPSSMRTSKHNLFSNAGFGCLGVVVYGRFMKVIVERTVATAVLSVERHSAWIRALCWRKLKVWTLCL